MSSYHLGAAFYSLSKIHSVSNYLDVDLAICQVQHVLVVETNTMYVYD